MKKKILLIEDDLDIQKIYNEILSSHGYEVILAATAQQGLHFAKELQPNLIFLDIMLPGEMNGLELLERIKIDENLKNIPIIVITNLDTEKESALKSGAVDYLIKSNVNIDDIIDKANKFCR